jgi:GTP1/Obg family GTP-binding protein
MARRSNELRTVIKIAKTIDRAAKQAERDRQRRNREIELEAKARQRRAEQAERARVRAEAQAIKDEFQTAKACFEDRAEERRLVKEDIISAYMR